MSAICPSCGASLPAGAVACPACGADAPTAVQPLPPHETGPVPVHFTSAQPRWFGVAPAALLLVLAGFAALAGILLFALGHWPAGLILLGLALLLLAAFAEAAKRKPDSPFARRSYAAFRAARERAGVAVSSAAARTRAQRELARARHELVGLQRLRGAKVTELGEATLADDTTAAAQLTGEIRELEALAAQTEGELDAIADRTDESIRNARLSVQETMVVVPDPPHDPDRVD